MVNRLNEALSISEAKTGGILSEIPDWFSDWFPDGYGEQLCLGRQSITIPRRRELEKPNQIDAPDSFLADFLYFPIMSE